MNRTDSSTEGPRLLPLIPLSEEVCFPRTEIQLRLVEPEYRRLIEQVAEGGGRLGIVLLRSPEEPGDAAVYGAGTAARLLEVEDTAEGCHILLEGLHRFELERLVVAGPWREAWVQPVDEPYLSELDPEVQELRREILGLVERLSTELRERFALGEEELRSLFRGLTFEATVNHLSANLDLPAMKKLQLLRHALPDRALHLLTILRVRLQVLDVLRPYRHLAPFAEHH